MEKYKAIVNQFGEYEETQQLIKNLVELIGTVLEEMTKRVDFVTVLKVLGPLPQLGVQFIIIENRTIL